MHRPAGRCDTKFMYPANASARLVAFSVIAIVTLHPASSFAAKTRVDWVDFDTERTGHSTAQLSLGVNFRPTQDTVLKLDYVRGRSHDEFNNPADHARFLLSIATYF